VTAKNTSWQLDRKYHECVQLPAKAKFGGFCRQHLATLATPTIRSIKCKQSPVYRVSWPLLPHASTDHNETRTWSSFFPRNLPIKCGTNPSTIFLVIVVTDRQTHTQTNAGKNVLPRFRGKNGSFLATAWVRMYDPKKLWLYLIWQLEHFVGRLAHVWWYLRNYRNLWIIQCKFYG